MNVVKGTLLSPDNTPIVGHLVMVPGNAKGEVFRKVGASIEPADEDGDGTDLIWDETELVKQNDGFLLVYDEMGCKYSAGDCFFTPEDGGPGEPVSHEGPFCLLVEYVTGQVDSLRSGSAEGRSAAYKSLTSDSALDTRAIWFYEGEAFDPLSAREVFRAKEA